MTQKSNALRLADALEFPDEKDLEQAAAELRRLHAENEALRAMSFDTKRSLESEAQREELLAALRSVHRWMDDQADGQSKGGHATFDLLMLREQRDIAEAAIAKVEGGAP